MPTVTKITEQKRSPNRRSVYLDGAFAFGCNLNVVARYFAGQTRHICGQINDPGWTESVWQQLNTAGVA